MAPVAARRLSRWVRTRDYTGDAFFAADGAGADVVATRKAALDRLSSAFRGRHARSFAWSAQVRERFSDLRFTDANRVPFPFARVMRERFNLATVVTASDGPRLRDLDGHWSLDVSGSYGVNVAGFDRYKEWIQQAGSACRISDPCWVRCIRLSPTTSPALKSISGPG